MTTHFTIEELTKSIVARNFGYDEQYDPPIEIINNLNALAENILQPLRDATGSPIYIHSGYRCERVNKKVGGANSSQHLKGQAADIEDYKNGNKYLFDKILELNLPFDQLINEFDYSWIHVSFSERNRRQILKAVKENGKTKYYDQK